jgi:hypothetical protein
MPTSTLHLVLIPTRWFSEDRLPKHHEDNVVIYGIAGLPRSGAGDIRRVTRDAWELWLTDATGVLRPIGVFDTTRAALDACAERVAFPRRSSAAEHVDTGRRT